MRWILNNSERKKKKCGSKYLDEENLREQIDLGEIQTNYVGATKIVATQWETNVDEDEPKRFHSSLLEVRW